MFKRRYVVRAVCTWFVVERVGCEDEPGKIRAKHHDLGCATREANYLNIMGEKFVRKYQLVLEYGAEPCYN